MVLAMVAESVATGSLREARGNPGCVALAPKPPEDSALALSTGIGIPEGAQLASEGESGT